LRRLERGGEEARHVERAAAVGLRDRVHHLGHLGRGDHLGQVLGGQHLLLGGGVRGEERAQLARVRLEGGAALVERRAQPVDVAVLGGPAIEVRRVGGAPGAVAPQRGVDEAVLAVVVYVEELDVEAHEGGEVLRRRRAVGRERGEAVQVPRERPVAQPQADYVGLVWASHGWFSWKKLYYYQRLMHVK